MDWYVDGSDAVAVSDLRRDIAAYLNRHSDPTTSDTDAAEVVVSELLANVVRHARGPAWVSLTWSAESPEVVVYDLGSGFDAASTLASASSRPPDVYAADGRGLLLVSAFAPRLESAVRRSGGTRIGATLPVKRRAEHTVQIEPRRGPSLPALDEALPEGGFDRETFLRALVVEMGLALASAGGPALSEQVVAQVGTGVGAQMEAEFRLARELAGRLEPAQIGECLVRLKHAIDGGFSVVELSDERIVLANDRCPFGPAVQRAPALCRMTSSVFGGIAARNSPDGVASVVLEERIAVGDPGCRVVVQFGEAPSGVESFAHRYVDERRGADGSQPSAVG